MIPFQILFWIFIIYSCFILNVLSQRFSNFFLDISTDVGIDSGKMEEMTIHDFGGISAMSAKYVYLDTLEPIMSVLPVVSMFAINCIKLLMRRCWASTRPYP